MPPESSFSADKFGGSYYVALMGDIVKSRSTKSVPMLYSIFNKAVDDENVSRKGEIASPLTITLGDEFQGILFSLTSAVEMARRIRLGLIEKGAECRFVIGIVNIKTRVNTRAAWNMMGPGLAEVRSLLNEKDGNAYRFYLPSFPDIEVLADAIGFYASSLEKRWTERQLQVVLEMLGSEGGNPMVAEKLRVSRQAVSKISRAAGFTEYQQGWMAINEALQRVDEQCKKYR